MASSNMLSEAAFESLSEPGKRLYNELLTAANQGQHNPVSRVGYAIMQEGNQLPEPLPQEILDAVDEIRAAGVDIKVSAGDSMRCIQIPGIRIQGNRGIPSPA